MEKNPYTDPYNAYISSFSRQEQVYEYVEETSESWGEEPSLQMQEQVYSERAGSIESWQESPQQTYYQKIYPTPRIPNPEAQDLFHRLKQGLLISSIVGFGTISWLLSFQQTLNIVPPQPPMPMQYQGAEPFNGDGSFFEHHRHHHHHRDYFGQDQGQYSRPSIDQNQNTGIDQNQNTGIDQNQNAGSGLDQDAGPNQGVQPPMSSTNVS